MKKSVILAVLGLAAGVATSFGQGSLSFNSYNAGSSGSTTVNFSAGLGGGLVSSGYSADILYSLSAITEAAGSGALTGGWILSGAGAPSQHSLVTAFGTGGNSGDFTPTSNFTLLPYTAGTTVYFEIVAYQTSAGSYANSAIRGHSASFSDILATGLQTVPDATYGSFQVFSVPEPTTLALAGLGGLSLLMLRRKQS